jgi:uncharacterized membrane protein YeiH
LLATRKILKLDLLVIMDIPPLLASFMGVLTGAMGGILRDVLCGEAPVVFNSINIKIALKSDAIKNT